MKKLFFFYCIFLLLNVNASENIWYLSNSLGVAYQKTQNFNMSPLLYHGGDAAVHSGFFRKNEKNLHALDLFLFAGTVFPKENNRLFSSRVNVFRILAEYNFLHRIEKKILTCDIHYGLSVSSANNIRNNSDYSNNNIDYDCSVSLNITGLISRDIAVGSKMLNVSYHPYISILTYNVVPSFSSTIPDVFTRTPEPKFFDYLNAGKLVSLNKFQNLVSEISCSYFLANGNAFRLMYRWDLSNTTVSQKITMASHSFLFSTLFRIK